jgi:hypothetical protein
MATDFAFHARTALLKLVGSVVGIASKGTFLDPMVLQGRGVSQASGNEVIEAGKLPLPKACLHLDMA